MKNIFYITVVLLSFRMIAAAQVECPGTLVHYWKLNSNDGGFADNVGGLTAQVEAEPLPIIGIVESGQYFNGLSELNVPDDITFDWKKDDSFTIEFWINKSSNCPSTSPQNNNVVMGRDDPNSGLHWWVGVDCPKPGKINFTLLANDGNGVIMKTKQGILDANWHHVAVVRDGESKSTSIFLDSQLDTSVNYTYAQGFGSIVPLNIGWLNRSEGKYHLDAKLDELGIHNVALSPADIADHYNSGAGKLYCTGTGTPVDEIQNDFGFNVFSSSASSEIRVRFNLTAPQHVSLAIFDISGRNLGYLINEQLNTGDFEKTFRTNQFGRNTLLIIQARFANGTVNRKIVLQ